MTAGFIADAIGRKPYMYLIVPRGDPCRACLIYVAPQTLTVALICVFILGVFTLGVFSWMPIYLPELFRHPCSLDGRRRHLQPGAFGRLSAADPHRVSCFRASEATSPRSRPHPLYVIAIIAL